MAMPTEVDISSKAYLLSLKGTLLLISLIFGMTVAEKIFLRYTSQGATKI